MALRNNPPLPDGAFLDWANQFVGRMQDVGALYGFTPAELTALADALEAFGLDMTDHRAKVDAALAARQKKDATKRSLLDLVRPGIRRLQAAPNMSDAERATLGINIPTPGRTPPPVPATRPLPAVDAGQRLQHTLRLADESEPSRRARPAGVNEAEVRMVVLPAGAPAPSDPLKMPILGQTSKTTLTAQFAGDDAAKQAWYCACWLNSRDERGPWSQMVSATIAA
jgi:hypothetical protein